MIVKEPNTYKQGKEECPNCQSKSVELLEEIDFIDFAIEQAEPYGSDVKVVSIETSEGEQFFKGFGERFGFGCGHIR